MFFRLISVMTLDLGKSHFFTTDAGSSNVRDIIFEKVPKTLLLFTSSTLIVTVIGIFFGELRHSPEVVQFGTRSIRFLPYLATVFHHGGWQ